MLNLRQSTMSDSPAMLVERAQKRGYVTIDEIQLAMSEAEQDVEAYARQVDDLFRCLYDEGISVFATEAEALEAALEAASETSDGDGTRPASDLNQVPISDGVGLYFAEIGRVPLLTRAEEVELAKRMEQGREAEQILSRNGLDVEEADRLRRASRRGQEARDHLIRANTRLVVSIAKRYRGMGLPFLDLVQAGNLGLIKGVDKYDYRRGTKLGTLATWWIRQAVTRSLSRHGRTIRLPIHMAGQIRKLNRAAEELAQIFGRDPTPEEIARSLGTVSPDRVRLILRVARRPLSLERPVGEENDEELGNLVEDLDAPSPPHACEQELLRDEVAGMLEGLPPREVRALRMRYGLDGNRALSLQEIGDRMGVTRERARQILVKALRRLRHPRRSRQLRRYLR